MQAFRSRFQSGATNMAKVMATVGMVEDLVATTARIIMHLHGMRRRATWCVSASPAARNTIMCIGDTGGGTGIMEVMGMGTATGIGTNVNL